MNAHPKKSKIGNRKSKIKVVFFDAGGTLFRPYPSVGEIYARTALDHGVQADASELEKRFHDAWHARNGLASSYSPLPTSGERVGVRGRYRGRKNATLTQTLSLTRERGYGEKIERDWWYHLVKEVFSNGPSPFEKGGFRGICRDEIPPHPPFSKGGKSSISARTRSSRTRAHTFKNFDTFFEDLYDRFARADCWRLFEDALPTLRRLKAMNYRLGMISNWDHRLLSIVQGLGLVRYLEGIIASSAVGVAKPGLGIFRSALETFQIDAAQALHVGDSLEDDYHGAKKAGLQSILLDRHHKAYNGVARISTLYELVSLVGAKSPPTPLYKRGE